MDIFLPGKKKKKKKEKKRKVAPDFLILCSIFPK